MKTSDSIINISKALAAAQGVMKNPECNETVNVHAKAEKGGGKLYSYKYATLPKCFDAVREPFKANGLSHSSGICGSDLFVRILHESGEWIQSSMPLDLKLSPKDLAGDVTFWKRYLFNGLSGIAGDDDISEEGGEKGPRNVDRSTANNEPENMSGGIPKISRAQADTLATLATELGLVPLKDLFWPDVFNDYNVSAVGELNEMEFEDISQRLKRKIAEKKTGGSK